MASSNALQYGVAGYRKSGRNVSFRRFYAIHVVREFRSVHNLTITELSKYLNMSRSTTQRLCQYGVALRYDAKTWEKVFEFVENLPPVQKKLF